jgi:hypothetical protein
MSTIWNSEKKPDAESGHGEDESIKRLRNDPQKKGETSILQHPRPYLYQRQSNFRKLIQAGFLLLSLVVFHYVYFVPFLPRKVNHSDTQDQTPSLHFSTPTGTNNAPTGLFIDDDKIWHIYFQC